MTSTRDVRHIRVLQPWRVAYGAESRRRLAWSILAVPRAVGGVLRAARHPGRVRALARALLALPVAAASSALTAALAFLVLINVLAYPFRPWLGLGGSTEDIWASRYADSWGGPTLAGAWATHAGLLLLLGVPLLTWAVRGLTGLQRRLTGTHRAATPTAAPRTRTPASAPAPEPTRTASPGQAGRTGRRAAAVLRAVALLVTSSLTAHAAGIGDNILWTPRDAISTLALAVTLAPVAALLLLTRTPWWRAGSRVR